VPDPSFAQHHPQSIGVERQWQTSRIEFSRCDKECRISVDRSPRARLGCPECDRPCAGNDSRERRRRQLATVKYRMFRIAAVPRWDPGSGFTRAFEAFLINWLREANVRVLSRRLPSTWDEVAGRIQQRAVARGLPRRDPECRTTFGGDGTAFHEEREYGTPVHYIGT